MVGFFKKCISHMGSGLLLCSQGAGKSDDPTLGDEGKSSGSKEHIGSFLVSVLDRKQLRGRK